MTHGPRTLFRCGCTLGDVPSPGAGGAGLGTRTAQWGRHVQPGWQREEGRGRRARGASDCLGLGREDEEAALGQWRW